MSQATPCTTTPTNNTNTTALLTPAEFEAIRLYSEEGLSIENVRKTTGLPNHHVRALLKGKPRALNTPLSKSVARVYELAIRPQASRTMSYVTFCTKNTAAIGMSRKAATTPRPPLTPSSR